MEEEFVALHQVRVKEKELKDGNKREREQDDETLLASLKGSPLGVGSLEEVSSSVCSPAHDRLSMMTMPS